MESQKRTELPKAKNEDTVRLTTDDVIATPLSNELMNFIKKLSPKSNEETDRAIEIVKKFSYVESKNSSYLDIINDNKLLKLREELLSSFKYSDAYIVDIIFDYNNQLAKINTINLRHSGIQNRHITPITIVEKIIKSVLSIHASPEDILKNLLYKVEFFRPYLSKEQDELVNNIFKCYKTVC